MTKIILLDIDGVLVHPGGYRASLRATVERFIDPALQIADDLLNNMEKHGIISEWDMSPLIIAAYWEDVLSRQPMTSLPDDVSAAAKEIQHRRSVDAPRELSIPEFDLLPGQYPSDAAFQAGCFPSIPEMLRKKLLTGTRSVHNSHTMRTFQHFTLGSRHFEETYNLQAEFETESLLLKYDHSTLDESTRAALFRDGSHVTAFTSRPSHPPREVSDSTLGYAPEAELALELVGLENIPLVAFGKLEYIAAQHQLDPAKLLKPSPFQALAATLAAWTGEELSALTAAYNWHCSGKLNSSFCKLPKAFELVIVEDTISGIRSVRAAGEIFQKAGFDVTVRAVGLTGGIPAKAAAFDAADVTHFDDWEAFFSVTDL